MRIFFKFFKILLFTLALNMIFANILVSQNSFEGEIIYKVERTYFEEQKDSRFQAHEALYPDSIKISIQNDKLHVVEYGSRKSHIENLYLGTKQYLLDHFSATINEIEYEGKLTYKDYKRKNTWYKSLEKTKTDSIYLDKSIVKHFGTYEERRGTVSNEVWYWEVPLYTETGNTFVMEDKGIALIRKLKMDGCGCTIHYLATRISEKPIDHKIFELPKDYFIKSFPAPAVK